MAAAAAFLVSDASAAFATGVDLEVDGGMLLAPGIAQGMEEGGADGK